LAYSHATEEQEGYKMADLSGSLAQKKAPTRRDWAARFDALKPARAWRWWCSHSLRVRVLAVAIFLGTEAILGSNDRWLLLVLPAIFLIPVSLSYAANILTVALGWALDRIGVLDALEKTALVIRSVIWWLVKALLWIVGLALVVSGVVWFFVSVPTMVSSMSIPAAIIIGALIIAAAIGSSRER
jgi:hypothetical protein